MRCTKAIERLEIELRRANARIRELEDRLDSRSLAEFKTFSGPAMPASEPDDGKQYVHDASGLFSFERPEPE